MNNSAIICLKNACFANLKRMASLFFIIGTFCFFGSGRAIAADTWTLNIPFSDNSMDVYVDNNLVSTCNYPASCNVDLSSRVAPTGSTIKLVVSNISGMWGYAYTLNRNGQVFNQDSCGVAAVSSCGAQISGVVKTIIIQTPNIVPAPADMSAIVGAQISATLRTTQQVMSTVQQRLETIHGDDTPGFSNGLGFSSMQRHYLCGEQRTYLERVQLACQDLRKSFIPDPNDQQLIKNDGSRGAFGSGGNKLVSPDFNAWIAGRIILGNQKYSDQGDKSKFTMSGVTAGVDKRFLENFKAGFAITVSSDSTKIDKDAATNGMSSVTGTAYASWRATKQLFIDTLLGYGRVNFSTSRYDNNASSTLTGSRSGSVLFGSVLASSEQKVGALKFAPYVGVDIISGSLNAYSETGETDLALRYDSTPVMAQGFILGIRGQYDVPMYWGALSPIARLQLRHGISGNVTQSLSYAQYPSMNYVLIIKGMEQDTLSTSLGLRFATKTGSAGQIEFVNNASGSGRQSNGIRGMMMVHF